MIDIAISTVDRSHNYVHKVIANLHNDTALRLIVGSPSYAYLKRYCGNSRIEIVGVDLNEWERFRDCPVEHKASWNYWRCFVYGPRQNGGKGLLILEDDVLPAKIWEKRLSETIAEIECQYGEEYVLALYCAHPAFSTPSENGMRYRRYPAYRFINTQAMYYPEAMRAAFAEYLKKEGVESFRIHYDRLLNEYLRITGVPLFATTPCLFEHIGEVSTGLSVAFHRAGSFSKRTKMQKGEC